MHSVALEARLAQAGPAETPGRAVMARVMVTALNKDFQELVHIVLEFGSESKKGMWLESCLVNLKECRNEKEGELDRTRIWQKDKNEVRT